MKMFGSFAVIFVLILAASGSVRAEEADTNGIENYESALFEKGGEKLGVLVVAHGSDEDIWCEQVRKTVSNVSLPYPIELGFLEFVPEQSICNAVDRLESQGVNEIIAVPLFISSFSNHIQEIEYILRLNDSPSFGENLTQVDTTANITMTRALDDHPLVAYSIVDQIARLSEDPSNETVVILSHGTDDEENLHSQVCCQRWLAEEIKTYLRYWANPSIKIGDVKYAFIHGNKTLYPDLTVDSVMLNATNMSNSSEDKKRRLIVLPLMVADGSTTEDQIPTMLKDYDCIYERKALAYHPNLARWIENRVRCEIGDGIEGVLIVDHGSSDPKRAEAVRKLAGQVNLGMPVAAAFAENAAEEETIPGGIARLLDQGVSRIIAVTLFTGDTIDHEQAREEIYSALHNVNHSRILMTSSIHSGIRAEVRGPIDDHMLIAELLIDRAREVSKDEECETLIIAPWCSSTCFEESELQAKSLVENIKENSEFKDVAFGFTEYQGSPNIRETVQAAQNGSVIVISVNSMGTKYLDDLIAKRLEGLNYTYNGKGFYGYAESLDAHPNIARWIENKVAEVVSA